MNSVRARQGNSVPSLAHENGHFWETVWEDGANAALRQQHPSANQMAPGDEVAIPDLRPKNESGATEQKHRFVRRGVPSMLRLQRKTLGEPRANEKYLLEIDGEGEAERSDSPRRGYGDRVHRLQPHARRVLRYEGTRPAADRGGLPGRADDASTAIGRRRRIQSRSAWPFDQGCSRFTPSSKRPCPTPGR